MIRGFQWDLARQVERLEVLQRLLPKYAAWGFQELYLHLEDAVEYPSLPGIARGDAYSHAQIQQLVGAAGTVGIRVVPIVNLLGHTQYLIKHPELRELNELRNESGDPMENGQICPLHPRFAEVATKLIADMAPFCTAGKLHVGLDESFHLGKCPRCREEVARVGLGGHFANHVQRLHGMVAKHGLQLGIWADMLYFVPEAMAQLPRGIAAYDWYYYPFSKAPRVEFFNFKEVDLAPSLKRAGVDYYGCPMNGAFRHEPLPVFGDRLANIRSWWERCRRVGAAGMVITSWEAYRLALETTTLVDAAAATLWLEPERGDASTTLLERGLERLYPRMMKRTDVARLLLTADDHAFAGYARWQINERWDVFAGTEGLRVYEKERAYFARLDRRELPPALASSVSFRKYLAERDVFVRENAREIFRWRRRLRKGDTGAVARGIADAVADAQRFQDELDDGKRAARTMWSRTRAGAGGQNAEMLKRDEARLTAWRAWLKRAAANLALVQGATPLCGAWQLQFWVHNFAPAVQKVVVEAEDASGDWREIASRYTIEFRARAARETASNLKHEFTVPVDSPEQKIRIAVRGVGQVGISHVQFANGLEERRTGIWRERKVLGRKAPTKGFPVVDWLRNAESVGV